MTRPVDRARVRRYRVCGITLESDIPFPELPRASDSPPEGGIQLRCRHEQQGRREPEQWFLNQTLPTGEPWMSAARASDGYVLRFHGWADFFLDRHGRRIVCLSAPGVARDALRHLVLDHLLPLALAQQGRHVLHATAVLTAWGVCAFTGPAGAGKSTLAAGFLRKDCPVVCDDCLVLRESTDGVEAIPAYPGVRLHADSLAALKQEGLAPARWANDASGKCRLASRGTGAEFPTAPRPLAGLYLLSDRRLPPGVPPRLEPVDGPARFMALLTASFTLDVSDRSLLERHFDFFSRLSVLVPMGRLMVPDDFSILPAVEDMVLADLRQSAARPAPDMGQSMVNT